MSWNGTVTCRECYKTGHNRNGCPRRKERYQEALAKPEGEREHHEKRLIEKFEHDKKRRSKPRKCSYCNEQAGHNRRKCPKLAEHAGYVQKQQVAFRKAFLEHIQGLGLNVGALVRAPGSDNARVHVVTEIRWDLVHIKHWAEGETCFISTRPIAQLANPRSNEWAAVVPLESWPVGDTWRKENRYTEERWATEVISSCRDTIEPPSGWLTSENATKKIFEDREAWQWPREDGGYNTYRCDYWNLEEKEQELEKIA